MTKNAKPAEPLPLTTPELTRLAAQLLERAGRPGIDAIARQSLLRLSARLQAATET